MNYNRICGIAIGTLGISSEEFFDLSPVEFYYALQHASKLRRARSRELYEIARFEAVLIINPQLGTKAYQQARDYVQFTWEDDIKPKQQSVEEMKNVILSIARANKAEFKERK